MSLWETVTWDIARAGGLTAYILLTIAVALGLALSTHIQSPSKWPRLVNNELHNFLTLLALIFTIIHILAVTLDPFTHFGLNQILIPFVTYYRPLWMSLGIVAFYLGLAIGISTWIRPFIGYTWWRRLHVFTLLIFALVTVHGIATGTDTRTWWVAGIYAISVILVGGLIIRHFLVPATAQNRARPGLAIITALVLIIGCVWALIGPFQANWASAAGSLSQSSSTPANASSNVQPQTPQQVPSIQSTPVAPTTPSTPGTSNQSSDPFATAFSAMLQGTLTQDNTTSTNSAQTIRMDMTLSNGAQGNMTIVLQGQPDSSGDGSLNVTSTQVTLGQTTSTPLYKGTLTSLNSARRLKMTAQLNKTGSGANTPSIEVQIELSTTSSGQISGTIQGMPTTGNSTGSPSTGPSGGTQPDPSATPSTPGGDI